MKSKSQYEHERIRRRFAELRAKYGGKCVLQYEGCLVTERLEFAHVKDTGLNGEGRGSKRRYYDVLRHPRSYVLACKNCHAIYDAQVKTRR